VTGRVAILAVDGGNSKVEVLLVTADGEIRGSARGGTISHEQVGLEAGIARLQAIVASLAGPSGSEGRGMHPVADVGVFCLAGADFADEVRMLRRAIGATGLSVRTIVRNDAYAALRAGAARGWGVAIICGEGVNGVAVGPDGRTAGFDAVQGFAGDWGSGATIGRSALAAAARAIDGRAEPTVLAVTVPAYFGRARPSTVIHDLYHGRLDEARLSELAPLVFEAAEGGDAIARAIVDRVADELILMVRALVRRTGLVRRQPEVVLAGGVFRNRDLVFQDRLAAGVEAAAPGARLVRLALPPVVGAALLGLDALGLPPERAAAAEARLRTAAAALEPATSPPA
jgi:N-acetylglucosamine kinase-like BadF-type ATPase